MFILLILTTILALLPLAIYSIKEEDIEWFCETGRRGIETEYTGGSQAALLEAKDFVDDIDSYLALRAQVICTEACPCNIVNYLPWNTKFGHDFDMSVYRETGETTDWESCEEYMGVDEDENLLDKKFDSLLNILEDEFDCQGICSPGMFWLYREVTDGPPEEGCLLQMKQRFNKGAGAAVIVLFITIAVDLLLWICMFGLCRDKVKDKQN